MSQHLTNEHLQQFRTATAEPKELVRMDRHLAVCPACRERLAAAAVPAGFAATLLQADTGTHLTYEQIESYVQSQVDEIDREIVTSHTEFCSECADRVQNLQSFATVLATPVAVAPAAAAASPRASFWERAAALLRPARWNYAVIGAIASVLVITILVRERNAQFADSGSQGLTLATLPRDYQQLVESTTNAPVSDVPGLLGQVLAARTTTGGADALISPKDQVVREPRPLFRWRAVPQASGYRIEVRLGSDTVTTAMVSGTEWMVDSDLQRGNVYSWSVTPYINGSPVEPGPGTTAWFGVISDEQERRLIEILARYPDVGLLRAAANLDAGLIDDAESELTRTSGNGQSELALKLKNRISAIRGRLGR